MNNFIKIIKTILPALIFSLCIIQLSFGFFFNFQVVFCLYIYFFLCLFILPNYKYPKGVNLLLNKKIFLVYVTCIILYLIKFLGNGYKYENCRSDMFNVLWWSIFGILLVFQINNGLINIHQFWKYVYRFVFFGSIVSASFGLYKYINILNNNLSSNYYYNKKLIIGSSLNGDYNIYAFGLFLGVLYSFEFYKNSNANLVKICFYIGNAILLSSMFLSGSRRGVILFFCIVILFFLFNKINDLKFQFQLFRFFIIPLLILVLILIFSDDLFLLINDSGLIHKSISRIFTIFDQITGENERIKRFNWAIHSFNNASAFEQLFGQGFNYLQKMGMKYHVNEDYPHNFLLSSLLFGGIVSFIFSILLVYYLLEISFTNNKTLYFTILFLIFIAFTSSNYLFSYRIFPVLTFLVSVTPYSVCKFSVTNLK